MIDKILTQLTYNPHEPMIFSSGLFLVLFLGFTFVYMLLQRKLTARLLFVTMQTARIERSDGGSLA